MRIINSSIPLLKYSSESYDVLNTVKALQMPRQQNCEHLVTVDRAKQCSCYDADDQKSLTTASLIVLGELSPAHTW